MTSVSSNDELGRGGYASVPAVSALIGGTLTTVERELTLALECKERGTLALKSGDFGNAEGQYSAGLRKAQAAQIAMRDEKLSAEMIKDLSRRIEAVCLALNLNLAQACLKSERYERAISACDAALEWDKSNVKALYRRAVARQKDPSGSLDKAKEDLKHVLELEPKNQEARREYSSIVAQQKDSIERHKQEKNQQKGWMVRADKAIYNAPDAMKLELLKPRYIAENAQREAKGWELLTWDEFNDLEASRMQKQAAMKEAARLSAIGGKYSGNIHVDLNSVGKLPNPNDAEILIDQTFNIEIKSPCVGGAWKCTLTQTHSKLKANERVLVVSPPSVDFVRLVRQAVPLYSSQFRPSGYQRVPDPIVEDIARRVGEYIRDKPGVDGKVLDKTRLDERQKLKLHNDHISQTLVLVHNQDSEEPSVWLVAGPTIFGRTNMLVLLVTILKVHKTMLLDDPEFIEREAEALQSISTENTSTKIEEVK